ncbi:NAC domain-containing protein 66 [Coffea arabica]|uniref:NAC domain-containing protein 66 n=1 Tax=Coffea arabica TaxID=13443 RepID=A0A6P6V9J5_COFAR|nr:NAC domain-containing protein 66-like [Coffea arabica]
MVEDYAIGCRFRPSEEELLYLLRDKVTNPRFQYDQVKEKKLYGEGASPWNVFSDDDLQRELFDDNGSNGNKRMVYVFTELNKLSAKKAARTAGSGTWDGEAKITTIQDMITGEQIGKRKMLSYVLHSGSEVKKGRWIMHEYAFAGACLNGIGSSIHNTD